MIHHFKQSARRLLAPYSLLLAMLLAPCPLLLSQGIVPHRDIQSVDSLNRGKPATAPTTVIKDGYFLVTRDDGYSYWEKITPYLMDSLRLDTLIGGSNIFYDLGTSDAAVPADDSVETAGVKYLLFNGLYGGLPTKIEMLKDGVLQFDQSDGLITKYAMKLKPLQQSEGNVDFNLCIATSANGGSDRNNDVAYIGWNMAPGGGLEDPHSAALGMEMENYYNPSGSEIKELHFCTKDTLGNNRRWGSFYMPVYDLPSWTAEYTFPIFRIRPIGDEDAYAYFSNPGGNQSYMRLQDPISEKGVSFTVDPTNNNMTIANEGMSSPFLFAQSFYATVVNKLNVQSFESTPDQLIGRNSGDKYVGQITDGWGINLTGGVLLGDSTQVATQHDLLGATSHAFHEVGTSSPPNAISDHIFKSSGSVAIGQSSAAAQTLHVQGTARITGSSGAAVALVGRDPDGDICSVGPGDGFTIVDNELQLLGGSDSLYQISDSLCFIIMGDTTCASLDSVAYYETEVCYWSMGDTTCLPFVNEGINVYNSNGAVTEDRTVTLDNHYLRIMQSGTQNGLHIRPTGNYNMVQIKTDYNDSQRSALQLTNNAFVGTERNSYIRYEQGSTNYAMGLDNSTPQGFTFSDSFNLKNPVFKYYSAGPSGGTAGDSLVFFKRTKFRSTLLDKDGDAGSSGNVLTSTATGIDWVAPSGGADADWYESGATPPNAITDEMYHTGDVHVGDATMAQTGVFNVEGLMKMRTTSTNTSMFLGGGNLTLSGTDNIAIGNSAGEDLTTGAYNILLGFRAGRNLTGNGNGSILIGREAGDALTTGANNVIIGGQTAIHNDFGSAVVIGYLAGNSADVDSSTIVGYRAGYGASNGGHRGNTILGYYAGSEMTGSGNVYIGKRAGYGLSSSNRLVIDNDASATKFITGDFAADTLRINAGVSLGARFEERQGADVASVAGAITLGTDGNTFEITGTNAITLISNVGWQNGSEITLVFTSTASLTDGTANSGTDIGMELEGNANFTGSADDIVKLTLCEVGGTQRWRMSGKSVN